jgi:hypothetical protein
LTRIREDDTPKTSPLRRIPNKLTAFDVSTIKQFGLATADDPFYETAGAKFFPEAVFFNDEGEVIGKTDCQGGQLGAFHAQCRD